MELDVVFPVTVVVRRQGDGMEQHRLIDPLKGKWRVDQAGRNIDHRSLFDQAYFTLFAHGKLYRRVEVEDVFEVAVFGSALHVVVGDVKKVKGSLKKAIGSAGIEITNIEEIEPSLEDVFVSLIFAEDLAEENDV